MKILVVNTDLTILEVMTRFLKKGSHVVTTVDSVDDAYDVISFLGENFDLIIMELDLPGMNVIAIIKRLKASNDDQKFIIISENSAKLENLELPKGVSVLNKPFSEKKLLDAVRDITA